MIKVSVIVPVYKVPLMFLKECLDSFVAQTMKECEFIVVSDGAPEPECALCKEYAQKDSRIRVFFNNHAGVSATRNFGIKQAKGEYITFVDSDDWIDSNNLDIVYRTATRNAYDVVFWDLCFFQDKNNILDSTSFGYTIEHALNKGDKQKYQKSIIWAPEKKDLIPALTVCKLISRKTIIQNNILFDQNLSFGEDRVFNFKVSQATNSIAYIPKTLYHYRQHPTSTMHESIQHAFTKHLEYINILNAVSSNLYPHEIANETICSFYGCISKVFFSNLSPKEKIAELLFLKNFINQDCFARQIKEANTNLNNKLFAIEIFLMKRKVSWLFSLRILKFKLIWFFQRIHKP